VLRRAREVALSGYMHQDVPFEKVVEALRPERKMAHAPLFQVKFVLQNNPLLDQGISEVKVSAMPLEASTAQLDLIMNLTDTGQELVGYIEYSTDLFRAATIRRMIQHYRRLLGYVAEHTEARLNEIVEMLTEAEKQTAIEEEKELEKASLRKLQMTMREEEGPGGDGRTLGKIRRKAVRTTSAGLIHTGYLNEAQTLPLLIQPAVKGLNLITWASGNRELIEAKLLTHGALLFRNFRLQEAADFEEAVRAISGELLEYKERSSPRTQVAGRIYTSTDYPAEHRIFPHNENSYQLAWPLKIFFFCERPAERGGATPLADCRKIYQRISASTRARFAEKQWMYMRNFGGGFGLDWRMVFQTAEHERAEEYCRRNGIEVEWRSDDRLRLRAVRPAIAIHPKTGETVWFNHAMSFHVTTLEPTVRDSLLAEFAEEDLPSNSYYGDGTPIEPEVLEEVRDAYLKESVRFDWQPGDLLLVDNMLVAHGREPYAGPRRVLVAMAEAISSER
jgi:alpha-ketoglutarate-dependent taurine dioxygenase